jgi:hypothetical protein
LQNFNAVNLGILNDWLKGNVNPTIRDGIEDKFLDEWFEPSIGARHDIQTGNDRLIIDQNVKDA